MLAIVDNENGLTGGQVRHQDRSRPLSRLVHKTHGAHHGLGNQMGVVQAGKFDEPDAVAHRPLEVSGGA